MGNRQPRQLVASSGALQARCLSASPTKCVRLINQTLRELLLLDQYPYVTIVSVISGFIIMLDVETRARFLVVAGAHLSPCAFGDLDRFVNYVVSRLDLQSDFSNAQILNGLRRLATRLAVSAPSNNKNCLKKLVSVDLLKLIGALDSGDWASRSLEPDVHAVKAAALAYLSHLGVYPRFDPAIEIVDTFPPPYEDADWSAMAPDEDDEEQYGIRPGIYLKRCRAYPFFTEATVAHELLHCVPRDILRGTFGMGLEEGICDLVGFLHVGGMLVGRHEVARAFIYYRLLPHVSHLRRMYVDHDRLALSMLLSQGVSGLCEVLSDGRTGLRELESSNLRLQPYLVPAHIDQSTAELYSLADWLLNRYLPRQVMPPQGLVALPHLQAQTSLSDVAARLGCDMDELRETVQRTSEATQLFLMEDDNRVGYSNVNAYLRVNEQLFAPMLRYDLTC